MMTRYSSVRVKEPTMHCFMPAYGPRLRILSATPGREVPAFHANGTPGGGPGMRGMHPPAQPPTPLTSQDIKQPPAHLPPQAHQIPPQSGGQMMQYALQGTGRGSTQQAPFYPPSRGPPGNQRMAPHPRPSVIMSNSAPSFMPQPVVQPVYQGQILSTQMSGQGHMFVGPPVTQPFPIQQTRHQNSAFYPPQQILVQQHPMFPPYPQQQVYYTSSVQPMSRGGGPAPNSQGAAPAQLQPPLTIIQGPSGAWFPNSGVMPPATRPKNVLPIINPLNGTNVIDEYKKEAGNSSPSKSWESSTRQMSQPPVTIINGSETNRDTLTDIKRENSPSDIEESSVVGTFPQSNAGQKTDQNVAAEFATRVVIAARGDHSGSPNSPALQQSSSITSNYSETESRASPEPQGISTPSVSPSKLDTSVDSISSESQVLDNNITYDTNQQATMIRSGWPSVQNVPVEMLPMTLHPGIMMPDDVLRSGGAIPNQPAREYQAVQQQWIQDANPVPVPVIISKEPAAQIESPARTVPERVTPVVSALAQGPTVEIGPRPQREQFPALGKGHQQQSPVKRKQRSEQTQEQSEGKVKDQQAKVVSQSTKLKTVTPTVDNKKQSTPPSQDIDENVQSVQTKNNETKTIIIKKNDSDSSENIKNKSNDSSINKENNNERVETRNLNEDINLDNVNRNKGEKVKCEAVTMPKESSPTPPVEELIPTTGKTVPEELQENVSFANAVPEPEIVSSTPHEDDVPQKTNGETITTDEDAKSNNQKSKPGNKRPAQSKMRLESKDSRNAEPETPAIEVTPSAPPVPEPKNSAPSTVVINDQLEKAQEETTTDDDKEKEKEDVIVAAKNEENTKQTTSMKTNDGTHTPAISNKIPLKYNYESDQWSPLNPDGKKKYDRDFIIGLKDEPQSKRKPPNFPSLELLNDNNKQRSFDRNVNNSMNRSNFDASNMPFGKNSSQRGGQSVTKRSSQQGKPKAAKPAVVQVSLQQDVKLHETENAWKPTRSIEPVNRTEEEAKTESLYKRVRGILNKLTPEKIDKLTAQVQALPIDNLSRLEGVIDLVFKKAVDEPSFSVAYAQMCNTLRKMEVPSDKIRPDGKPEPEKNFRKLLLYRCQQEFEKNTAEELKRDDRLKEIEQEKDPDRKKQLQLAFEDEERQMRRRSVGNIRFIGELYKMGMLTENIMRRCIDQLLSHGDEESLECLCKLLTTIGELLENSSKNMTIKGSSDKKKGDDKDVNVYFKKLCDIVKKRTGKVSSRVRFMIQDLIDLRNNKWVPRRTESQPKTMDQLQKEQEQENMERNLALNSPQDRNKRQDIRNSMESRKQRGVPDNSGWTTVTSSQPNKPRYVIEPSKLKIDQSDVEVAKGVSLGNRNQFMWSLNASSGKGEDKRFMPPLGTNKFAILSTPSSANSSLKGTSYSDKDRINSYKSLDDDGRSPKSGSQQDPNSRSSSRESVSTKRDDNRFISSANNVKPPSDSSSVPSNNSSESLEIISKKSKQILEDYLSCLNVNEATGDLKILFSSSNIKDFVAHIIYQGMECIGGDPKRAAGVILNHLVNSKDISKEQLFYGLSTVINAADDLALDMPLFWQYLAEILVMLVAEEVLNFKEIASIFAPKRGCKGSATFLAALVKLLRQMETKDSTWLEQRWTMSQVSLSDIIGENSVEDFARVNNVEFMLGQNSEMESIKSELSKLISGNSSFDEITAWVTKNVGEQKSTEPIFVRTLMTVLLEASVTKSQSSSYKLNTDLLSHYEQLIVRYTNHVEELELPCLFAIQAFVHKLEYPQSILHNIFNHLCDGGLIASESFKLWRDSKDPHEQEGHAVCVTSLTSFFTHLNEPETDDDP